jgi:fatty-acyl-CoA synthase
MLSTMQDAPLSVAQLLRHGSTVHSQAQVITWTDNGPRAASYGDVGRRCARLAHALRGLGVTGDQRVATFMWNNQEHLEAYLAVPSMGAVLHTLNIRLFADQLAHVVNDAEDHVILVDATLVAQLAPHLPELPTVRHLVVSGSQTPDIEVPGNVTVHSWEQLIADQPDEFEWPAVEDERTAAAICYTSGTTGDPKGVAYSHRSIWLHSMQVCMSDGPGLAQGDVALAIVPQFHVLSWGLPHAAFMIGASLLMPDRFMDPASLAAMIQTVRPGFSAGVPAIWKGLLQYLENHDADISSMELALLGGSAPPPSLMRELEDTYQIKPLHAWGMTETSPLGTVAHAPAGLDGEEAWQYRYTQGRIPASIEARLVDDNGDVVAHDGSSEGELELKGPWVTGSYYRESDSDKFDHGWFRTGDVGKISPDGFLTLTDRSKDIIKSGGEWISSVDLENLAMAHPDVLEAAVIGIPDEKWDERPLVTVVLRAGCETTPAQVREFMAGKVAKWQLPENWARIAEVPKTSVGKFDKKRLRSRYTEGGLEVEHV